MLAPTNVLNDCVGEQAAPRRRRVRSPARNVLNYELAVIVGDVAQGVQAVGGWMCDRAMAGWRVTVLIPEGSDPRPLQILGARTVASADAYETVRASSPTALAVASEVIAADERVWRDVQTALSRGATEVTVWGESPLIDLEPHLDCERHRLSRGARAFKSQALIATSMTQTQVDLTEEFRRAAMWRQPYCSDLAPTS